MSKLSRYELKRRALSIIFPNVCPFCGRARAPREYQCEACPELLPRIRTEIPPPESVSRLYACCWYSGIARDAVHTLKFGCLIYPADAFGLLMSEMLRGIEADAIVPVPSGVLSIEKRGFSPAEEIAKRVSLRLDIPVENALSADINKVEQKTLTAKGRKLNAKRSFHLARHADIVGKRLLIVDDVTTTGSTLSALAEILTDAGAAEVSAAVFAKTVGSAKRSDKPKIYRRHTVASEN